MKCLFSLATICLLHILNSPIAAAHWEGNEGTPLYHLITEWSLLLIGIGATAYFLFRKPRDPKGEEQTEEQNKADGEPC